MSMEHKEVYFGKENPLDFPSSEASSFLSYPPHKKSFTGKLKSWDKKQVQDWLNETLNDSQKFSPLAILKTLEKLREESGLGLVSFTKDQWKEKLSDCDDPTASEEIWKFVWTLVTERLNDIPLRPHNHPTKPSTGSPKTKTTRKRREHPVGQLWEFVYNLLQNKDMENVVRWEDKEKLLFRIVNTEEIAKLWGNHKGNSKMNYKNMSRTMRNYKNGNGAFVPNECKKVYGFGPGADLKMLDAKRGQKTGIDKAVHYR